MPAHDWTRVDAGIFHDFHTVWIARLRTALNEGRLPQRYYALAEQHAGSSVANVLTLLASPAGGTAVAEAAPRVQRTQAIQPAAQRRRRTLAIRHVSGHPLVALVEVVSPTNKDRRRHVEEFVAKAVAALAAGIHVLLVDLFPPGRHDAPGLHELIRQRLEDSDQAGDRPEDMPLTLASYAAAPEVITAHLSYLAVGQTLPDMPLFLRPDRYVDVPLEPTCQAAYHGTPAFWRDVLEGQGSR